MASWHEFKDDEILHGSGRHSRPPFGRSLAALRLGLQRLFATGLAAEHACAPPDSWAAVPTCVTETSIASYYHCPECGQVFAPPPEDTQSNC